MQSHGNLRHPVYRVHPESTGPHPGLESSSRDPQNDSWLLWFQTTFLIRATRPDGAIDDGNLFLVQDGPISVETFSPNKLLCDTSMSSGYLIAATLAAQQEQ